MKRLIVICLLAGVLAQAGLVAKEVATLETLFTMPGPDEPWPMAVSADGLVVMGRVNSEGNYGPVAWRWENGNLTPLGLMYVYDMSDDGSIIVGEIRKTAPAGYPNVTYGEAAFWKDGVVTSIGHLPGGDQLWSWATGISGDGSVIVGSSNSGAGGQLFLYKDGVMEGLEIDGYAAGISRDGSTLLFDWDSGPSIWRNGVLAELLPLGEYSPTNFYSSATNMSSDGSIVVGAGYNGQQLIPIRWVNNQPIALPFPDEAAESAQGHANGVSGDGRVVVGYIDYSIDDTWFSEKTLWREVDGWRPISLNSLFEKSGIETDPDDIDFFPGCPMSEDGSILIGRLQKQIVRIQILNMFGQHRIHGGHVDTGDWMGWLNVEMEPWAYCLKTQSWFYIPETVAESGSGWIYAPDIAALQVYPASGYAWSYSLSKWFYVDPTGSGWVYML